MTEPRWYGIRGQRNYYRENFLQNMQERVVFERNTLTWKAVTNGVPTTGLLLALYCFSFPLTISLMAFNLMSDPLWMIVTIIYMTVTNQYDAESLNNDLNIFPEWKGKWQMQFYTQK